MFLRLCAAVLAGVIIGVLWISKACALGYPIPQPKGCVNFWDSAKALRIAKHHPHSTGRYLSDPHFVLFGLKSGGAIAFTHDEKGCLRTFQVSPERAAKLLTDQEGT